MKSPNRMPLLVMSYCAFLLNTFTLLSFRVTEVLSDNGDINGCYNTGGAPKGPYALLDSPSSHQPLKEKQKRPGFPLPLLAGPIQQIWWEYPRL